jgi:hypothetical protein
MPRPWRPTPDNQIRARTTLSLLNRSEANIRQETSDLPLLALSDRSSISEAHTLPPKCSGRSGTLEWSSAQTRRSWQSARNAGLSEALGILAGPSGDAAA